MRDLSVDTLQGGCLIEAVFSGYSNDIIADPLVYSASLNSFADFEQRLSFTEESPFVEAHRRRSIAFERNRYNRCLSGNRKKVALQEGLSQSTVRDSFTRWARLKADKSGFIFTQVLGIDEISLKKRHKHYALVISDIERKCILAVLPIREKQALEEWLMQLTENQRKVIRFVSVDMWRPYHQAARKILPHANIVVDRFHVMKQLNDRVTQLRRRIQTKGNEEIQAVLKGSRWLVVGNRSGLSTKEAIHLQKIVDVCPEIRHLYLLKEEFRQIFERIHDRERAWRFLRCWKQKVGDTGNKSLMKFLKTLENFWDEIMNYFLERITNGFVEGLNGAIRAIIRRAFGYRNFQDFRFRVFAELGFPTNPR